MKFLENLIQQIKRAFSSEPVSRNEAAKLIEEFAAGEMLTHEWLDINLSGHFEDEVLDSVAKDFREIQSNYEITHYETRGVLSPETKAKLQSLISKLRE